MERSAKNLNPFRNDLDFREKRSVWPKHRVTRRKAGWEVSVAGAQSHQGGVLRNMSLNKTVHLGRVTSSKIKAEQVSVKQIPDNMEKPTDDYENLRRP